MMYLSAGLSSGCIVCDSVILLHASTSGEAEEVDPSIVPLLPMDNAPSSYIWLDLDMAVVAIKEVNTQKISLLLFLFFCFSVPLPSFLFSFQTGIFLKKKKVGQELLKDQK